MSNSVLIRGYANSICASYVRAISIIWSSANLWFVEISQSLLLYALKTIYITSCSSSCHNKKVISLECPDDLFLLLNHICKKHYNIWVMVSQLLLYIMNTDVKLKGCIVTSLADIFWLFLAVAPVCHPHWMKMKCLRTLLCLQRTNRWTYSVLLN